MRVHAQADRLPLFHLHLPHPLPCAIFLSCQSTLLTPPLEDFTATLSLNISFQSAAKSTSCVEHHAPFLSNITRGECIQFMTTVVVALTFLLLMTQHQHFWCSLNSGKLLKACDKATSIWNKYTLSNKIKRGTQIYITLATYKVYKKIHTYITSLPNIYSLQMNYTYILFSKHPLQQITIQKVTESC